MRKFIIIGLSIICLSVFGSFAEAANRTIENLVLTNPDEEFSIVIPINTRFITFQVRTADPIRFAFEAGKVATPTSPFATLKAGGAWDEERAIFGSLTIYFAGDIGGEIVEVIYGE